MIVGTAGHIDHGKSTLVEALTGRPMDPLAEERRRGITLDLHFAALELPGGGVAGVVDVPGHEDLVRTMAAGAAGMDLALLVIAADEGIMPQTREHLAVLERLGVPRGIPVVSRVDLVEPDWLALVVEEVRGWLSGSPVHFSAPMPVSARMGTGLEALRRAIAMALQDCPDRPAGDVARMPVDRAFSLAGTGTVVTGTTWSGRFRVGDEVRILPGGLVGRIRTLEEHGVPITEALPGRRIAAGVAGLERNRVGRGATLVHGHQWWPESTVLDVEASLAPEAQRPLRHLARLRVHLGTAEVLARVHIKSEVVPGTRAPIRLVLESPVVARGGDRLLLRSYSPVAVIGGGVVLDPLPPTGRPLWPDALLAPEPAERLRGLLARRPLGIDLASLPILLGVSPEQVGTVADHPEFRRAGSLLVLRTAVDQALGRVLAAVGRFHVEHASEPGLPLQTARRAVAAAGAAADLALADAITSGALVAEEAVVRLPAFRPTSAAGDGNLERIVAAVEAGGLSPDSVPELEARLGIAGAADTLRFAARNQRVVAVERERYFSPAALARFENILRELGGMGPITPADLRDRTGLSRKFLIPLLEWADRQGITRREGEGRRLVRPS